MILSLISFSLAFNILTVKDNSLPIVIQNYLDHHYYNWSIAEISENITSTSSEINNIVIGDFDGNKKEDYAIQITYQDTNYIFNYYEIKLGDTLAIRQSCLVFLFLDDSLNVKQLSKFHHPNPDIFLRLYRKGGYKKAQLRNKEILFSNDCFSLFSYEGIYEELYIYQNNDFKVIQYADI